MPHLNVSGSTPPIRPTAAVSTRVPQPPPVFIDREKVRGTIERTEEEDGVLKKFGKLYTRFSPPGVMFNAIKNYYKSIPGGLAKGKSERAFGGGVKFSPVTEVDPETGEQALTNIELLDPDERIEQAMKISAAQREQAQVEVPLTVEITQNRAARGDFLGMLRGIAQNPGEVIGYMVGENFFRAPLVGLASFIPGAGAILGFSVEQRAEFAGELTNVIQERGGDPNNADDVYDVLSDKELLRTAYDRSTTRATAVTATEFGIEMLTVGLSRKILPAGAGAKMIKSLAIFGSESIGEAAGEVAGQVSVGEELNLAEAALEGIVASGQSIATTIGHTALNKFLDKQVAFPKSVAQADRKIVRAVTLLKDEGFSEDEALDILFATTEFAPHEAERFEQTSAKTKRAVEEIRSIISQSPEVSEVEPQMMGFGGFGREGQRLDAEQEFKDLSKEDLASKFEESYNTALEKSGLNEDQFEAFVIKVVREQRQDLSLTEQQLEEHPDEVTDKAEEFVEERFTELPRETQEDIIDVARLRYALGVREGLFPGVQEQESLADEKARTLLDKELVKDVEEQKQSVPPLEESDVATLTGISNAIVARARKMRGSTALTPADHKEINKSIFSSIQKGYHTDALEYAQLILAKSKDESIEVSQDRQSGMTVRKAQIEDQHAKLISKVVQHRQAKNDAAAQQELTRANALLGQLEAIEEGLQRVGTELGRGLAMRKYMYDRSTFTVTNVLSYAREIRKRDLTLEETESLVEKTNRIKELEDQVDTITRERLLPAEEQELLELAESLLDQSVKRVQEEFKGRKIEDIRAEREEIKQRLRDLGANLHTGLDPRWLAELTKLAKTYMAEGVVRLEDLVNKLMDDMPSLKRADAIEAVMLTSEFDEIASEIDAEIEIERQIAEEWAKLSKTDPAEAIRLLQKMKTMTKGAQYSTEREKLRMLAEVDKLRKELAGEIAAPKTRKKKGVGDAEFQAIKRTLNELRAAKRARQEVARLQNMDQVELDQMMADIRRKREGKRKKKIPATDELREAKVQLSIARKDIIREALSGRKLTARDAFPEFNALFKTFRATADFSAILRQGLALLVTHPILSVRGNIVDPNSGKTVSPVAHAFRAYFSSHRAEIVDLLIQEDPDFIPALEYNLELTTAGEAVQEAEEFYMSEIIRRIPGMSEVVQEQQALVGQQALVLGAAKSVISGAERSMVGFLNLMRLSTMKLALDSKLALGDEELFLMARWINESTGRGTLKPGTAQALNNLLFAARFAASRFQTPVTNARMLLGKDVDPFVRKEAFRQIMGFVGLGVGVMGVAKLSGCEVGDDPKTSDWGKLICGNTRLDLFGGFQQVASLFARVAYGTATANEILEEDTSVLTDVRKLINNFSHYKFSPALSTFFELTTRKTAVGEPVELSEIFIQNNFPFWVQDAVDAYGEHGYISGTFFSTAAILGAGVSTYGDELNTGDLKPIVLASGYRVSPPRYNEATKDDQELKEQLDKVFADMVAKRMRANLTYLQELADQNKNAILKKALQSYAKDARDSMRSFLPESKSEEPVPEASLNALRRLLEQQ